MCSPFEGAPGIAREHPDEIHLLATDVVMFGMSGDEVADRVLELRPDMRLMYLSGYTEDALAEYGVLESGVPILQKPYTMRELVDTVESVLSASAGGA